MVNPAVAVLGLLLAFVAPGFFVVKAVFPRHRFPAPFHGATVAFFSVVTSAAITVLVGAALGFTGTFSGAATGAPNLELALGAVTALAAGAAWWRGGLKRGGAEEPLPSEPGKRLVDRVDAAVAHRAAAVTARRAKRAQAAARHDRRASDAEDEAARDAFGRP